MNEIQDPLGQISGIPSSPRGTPALPQKNALGTVLKIVGLVIVVAAVGAGVSLATRIWDPLWSPFRPSPEKVMASMSEKMLAVKSSHSELKINIETGAPNPGKVVINLSGDSDISDPANFKAEGNFSISFTGPLLGGAAETLSAKAKIKMLSQKEGYFNISEFNAPSLEPLFMMMGIDLNNIIGTWIGIPIPIPIEDKLGEAANSQTTALTEQMKKIMSESKVYVVKKQLPDQIIDNQKMYHYLVALDNEKTAQLIGNLTAEAMKQSNSNQPGQEMDVLLGVGATKGIISEFLNKIGEISAELLIGKNDNLLYGLKMEKSINLSKIDSKTQGVFDVSFETRNSRFNQPVKVEAPASFKTFEEILPSQVYNLAL